MQDRYTGDIGDYVKYGLLRALANGHRLGVAWYLYPDESHNKDGRHIEYLSRPNEWRHVDPQVFDALSSIAVSSKRSIDAIEKLGLLPNAVFANEVLRLTNVARPDRVAWRKDWFQRVLLKLDECKLVFADPDNGLCDDSKFRETRVKDMKRLPLREAKALAIGRSAIIYHHNSRHKGGHRLEINHWMNQLPGCSYAFYWRRFSNRTFFILNPTHEIETKLHDFVDLWAVGGELIQNC